MTLFWLNPKATHTHDTVMDVDPVMGRNPLQCSCQTAANLPPLVIQVIRSVQFWMTLNLHDPLIVFSSPVIL